MTMERFTCVRAGGSGLYGLAGKRHEASNFQKMASYKVIDADGHVLEPADLWLNYIEPKFRKHAPRIVLNGEGAEIMALGAQELTDNGPGRRRVKMGAAGAIGAREGKVSVWGKYADGKGGGFDPHKRIPDMDAEGIDAVFLYPTLGLFLGAIADADLSAAVCRAYNRWLADYCAPYPKRLFGVAMLPIQSVDLAVEEMRFAGQELGFRAAFVRPNPYNGRMLHDPANDALWRGALDLNLAIGIHSGAESGQPTLAMERFEGHRRAVRHCVAHTLEMMAAAASMIMCGPCDRFHQLRVGFLESGGGWMAGWLDRMDRHFDDVGMNDTGLHARPSEIFRRQCFISFEPVERSLVLLADYIEADNILWATDYPHFDGFTGAPQMIKSMGLPQTTLAKVLAGGALRFYDLKQE
jgi:predicted TIM-barrel fold metal-dependent hydrolase